MYDCIYDFRLHLQEVANISARGSPDGFSTTSAEPKFLSGMYASFYYSIDEYDISQRK